MDLKLFVFITLSSQFSVVGWDRFILLQNSSLRSSTRDIASFFGSDLTFDFDMIERITLKLYEKPNAKKFDQKEKIVET